MDEPACPGCRELLKRVAELEAQVALLTRKLDEAVRTGKPPPSSGVHSSPIPKRPVASGRQPRPARPSLAAAVLLHTHAELSHGKVSAVFDHLFGLTLTRGPAPRSNCGRRRGSNRTTASSSPKSAMPSRSRPILPPRLQQPLPPATRAATWALTKYVSLS